MKRPHRPDPTGTCVAIGLCPGMLASSPSIASISSPAESLARSTAQPERPNGELCLEFCSSSQYCPFGNAYVTIVSALISMLYPGSSGMR